ncbi:MAG: GNAT family N-acetyltransferase [bacterium]
MNLSNVSIQKTSKSFDFWQYVSIVIHGREWSWLMWIFIMTTIGHGKCNLFVVRDQDTIIGGFFVADFPVAKYKPYNIFNHEAKLKIAELRRNGYLGFCCFIISPEYRNSGLGSFVWELFFENHAVKVFFTASQKAVPFYLRHGAKVFYSSRHTIYTYETTNKNTV